MPLAELGKYARFVMPLPVVDAYWNHVVKKIGVKGATPPGPGRFWIEYPWSIVIGYHWLAFLNQVHKIH